MNITLFHYGNETKSHYHLELFFFSCCLAAFFFIICSLLSAEIILMFGVTTLEGDDDDELLEDIFTGVVEPDMLDGDLGPAEVFM